MPSLDVHAHLYPTALVDHLRRGDTESQSIAQRLDEGNRRSRFMGGAVDERLELMTGAGVDRQVLSITSQYVLVEDRAHCADYARAANDILADISSRYPDRLATFANLPLVDGDLAVRELERAVAECGALGITMPTHVLGRPLDWPGLDPVYEALQRMELPMFLHPGPPWHASTPPGYDDFSLTSTLYYPVEDAQAVLRMVCSGVLERFPRLRVICPHAGGPLSFLSRRIDRHSSPHMPDGSPLPHPPSFYLKKLMYDAVSQHTPAMRCACETFGADRFVLGTDFPYVDVPRIGEIMQTIQDLDLDEQGRRGILETNASAWVRWRS